jgi:hypothetical protein
MAFRRMWQAACGMWEKAERVLLSTKRFNSNPLILIRPRFISIASASTIVLSDRR